MHPHDESWVNEQINKLPLHLRPKILAKYQAVFDEAHAKEEKVHRKDCLARREANSRLRQFVENYEIYAKGGVRKPPSAK